METDGRDTNRQGNSGVSNVVPFPRDWIGPLDDLVPLNSAPNDEAEDEQLGQALGAQTFWSESSASLHQLIEAPAPESVPSEPPEAVGALDGVTAPREPSRHRSPRWRPLKRSPSVTVRRVRIAVACAAVACLAAGAAAAVESSTPVPRSAVMAGASQLSGLGTGARSSGPLRLSRLLVERAIQRTSGGLPGIRRTVSHHQNVPRKRPSASSAGSASHVNVSYNLPQASDSSSPASGAASSPVPNSTPAPAVQSQPSTSSGAASDATGSSSASGPSGPGAPFGPGQMRGG